MNGIELARASALGLLVLPVVLLLLARRPGRPERLATGTLEVWRAVAGARPKAARGARPRIPLDVWWTALALTLGALALAGPSPERAPTELEWRFVVDRSPSMYLPAGRDAFEGDLEGVEGRTRIELALERAEAFADEVGGRVTWVGLEDAGRRASLTPPRIARAAPSWSSCDAPGTVWVTDRAPDIVRAHAGLVASGGPAAPGPVGTLGSTRLDFDGERVVEVEDGAPTLSLQVDAALPEQLRELADYYAEARGFAVNGSGSVALALRSVGKGPDAIVRAAQDGFAFTARAAASGVPGELNGVRPTPWLRAAQDDLALIAAAPGVVFVALRELAELRGDPAAFPVAFAALFDEHALPAPGVVAMEERLPAGEPRFEPPRTPPESPTPASKPPWIAVLVLGALAAAVVSLNVRRAKP